MTRTRYHIGVKQTKCGKPRTDATVVVEMKERVLIDDQEAVRFKEGYYARRDGSIWSFWRPNGIGPYRVRSDLPPKKLAGRANRKGYVCITHLGYVHRLMWLAWHGDPGELQVRHLDGDVTNNALDNLALGTQRENESDKLLHGTRPFGDDHVNSKLTSDLVIRARRLWKSGLTVPMILDRMGLSLTKSTVHNAVTGRTWGHLDNQEAPMKSGHWTKAAARE